MTSNKHVKARIRARMAKTGERYSTARLHVVGAGAQPVTDHGWRLRGGVHPDSANIVALLGGAVSEAMVLGIGGGLGAGYILWEFTAHDVKHLTLGFRHRWNYIDWIEQTLHRLGVAHRAAGTAGAKGAAQALTAELTAGRPAVVWPDRYLVGYWQLPPHLDGHGGHPVIAYGLTDDGRVRVDDRNSGPLTVDRAALDRARARVTSYKNRLVVVESALDADLESAVRAGITECAQTLGGTSASFALPAWRKWARLITDTRNAKGWPTVFAGGTGLVGALLSIWEGVTPAGMTGGHLRDLYADFLDEAAPYVSTPTAPAAAAFRDAAVRWRALAEAALPLDVPEYARVRELTAQVSAGVADGDEGADARAQAAAQLWELRAEYDRKPPVEPDFAVLAKRIGAVADAEEAAVAELRLIS